MEGGVLNPSDILRQGWIEKQSKYLKDWRRFEFIDS